MKQVAVITGVAGAAGGAVADWFRTNGYNVVGVDLAPVRPMSLTIENYFGAADLTDPEATDGLFLAIRDAHGDISVLANVAGGFRWETVEAGNVTTWDHLWSINVLTCLNAVRASLPVFSPDGGAIVNVSAAATARAAAGMGAYAAAKSGVSRLTESLAEELKPRRIRVNAVLPSVLDTPANRADMPEADPALWVRPSELAEAIGFLASERASGVTGALLPVVGRV